MTIDNLQGVVNRIVLHRLPLNLAYLLSDSAKMAEVSSIAAVLALVPGVTYGGRRNICCSDAGLMLRQLLI